MDNMKFCPQCGSKVPEKAGFCPKCGAAFPKETIKTVETKSESAVKKTTQKAVAGVAKPSKKKKTPLIIGIAVAIVLVLIALLAFWGGSEESAPVVESIADVNETGIEASTIQETLPVEQTTIATTEAVTVSGTTVAITEAETTTVAEAEEETETENLSEGGYVSVDALLTPLTVNGLAEDITRFYNEDIMTYSYSDGYDLIFDGSTYYIPQEFSDNDYYKAQLVAEYVYSMIQYDMNDELTSNLMDIYASWGNFLNWEFQGSDGHQRLVDIYSTYFYYKTRLADISSGYEDFIDETQPCITIINDLLRDLKK